MGHRWRVRVPGEERYPDRSIIRTWKIFVRDLLKKHFGFDEFLPLQEEIVSSVLEGRTRWSSCRRVGANPSVISCPLCDSTG